MSANDQLVEKLNFENCKQTEEYRVQVKINESDAKLLEQ